MTDVKVIHPPCAHTPYRPPTTGKPSRRRACQDHDCAQGAAPAHPSGCGCGTHHVHGCLGSDSASPRCCLRHCPAVKEADILATARAVDGITDAGSAIHHHSRHCLCGHERRRGTLLLVMVATGHLVYGSSAFGRRQRAGSCCCCRFLCSSSRCWFLSSSCRCSQEAACSRLFIISASDALYGTNAGSQGAGHQGHRGSGSQTCSFLLVAATCALHGPDAGGKGTGY